MLERWVDGIPEVAYELLEAAVDPLTVVYDSPRGLAPELLADDGSAGVRIVPLRIFRRWHKPLVSTSANISGEPAPEVFRQISAEIVDAADYVCLSRREEEPSGVRPSSIIRLTEGGLFKIIR